MVPAAILHTLLDPPFANHSTLKKKFSVQTKSKYIYFSEKKKNFLTIISVKSWIFKKVSLILNYICSQNIIGWFYEQIFFFILVTVLELTYFALIRPFSFIRAHTFVESSCFFRCSFSVIRLINSYWLTKSVNLNIYHNIKILDVL